MILETKAVLPRPRTLTEQSGVRVIAPVEQVGGTSLVHQGLLLPVLTALLISLSPALAENRDGAFTFSPFAGGQGFPFGGETHYDGDFNYGARVGYNLTPHWRAELVFGANDTVHDPEVAYCTVYQYGADILYAFRPDKALVPFLAAGFGAFDVKYDGTFGSGGDPTASLSDETNPYFNYGGGAELSLIRWLALRAEFHHAIMLDSGDNVFQGTLGITLQF